MRDLGILSDEGRDRRIVGEVLLVAQKGRIELQDNAELRGIALQQLLESLACIAAVGVGDYGPAVGGGRSRGRGCGGRRLLRLGGGGAGKNNRGNGSWHRSGSPSWPGIRTGV